jgi:type IV secretion system protein VirD4
MVGVIRGLWAAFIYILGELFAGLRFLLFALCCSAAFGGIMYLISHHYTHPGDVTRGLLDAITVVFPPLIAYTIVREKIRELGRSAGTHGTARFANGLELRWLTDRKAGLLIGRDIRSGKLLRYAGGSHLMTMAPTRTGKGVGTVIPNLLTQDRSVICIDPKGENARITYRARSRFGPVHVLDPFGVTGHPSASFNPLAGLDPASPDLAEDAATLADALVHDAPGETGEAHWNEEAKALIAGQILYLVCHEDSDTRTLSNLRAHLTMPPEDFAILLKMMQGSSGAGGLLARFANRFLGKTEREASGVLSTAQRHTHFLDSPRMTAVLGRSDFTFGDLRNRTATVFLALPPDRLSTYARWLRLMVSHSLQDLVRALDQSGMPILYLLDEFAALGHLAPIERAMSLMAGYGVQLWPILQDVHQLRAAYGERAGTFLSNSAVLQVFGINDHDSARLVSNLLGQSTTVFATENRNPGTFMTPASTATSDHHNARPLVTPDEVRNLPHHQQLLFVSGMRPVLPTSCAITRARRSKDFFKNVRARYPAQTRASTLSR